jgi:hypothetical protein
MFSTADIISLPLTSKIKGIEMVPQRSGLNWGQRLGREPNQAYLAVPSEVQRSGFLPERGEEFLIECDDGEIMKCIRAQANGKAIETCGDNSILGLYFRRRLNVRPGYLVTIEHLYRYGRLSVDISFVNNYRYFLNFSRAG